MYGDSTYGSGAYSTNANASQSTQTPGAQLQASATISASVAAQLRIGVRLIAAVMCVTTASVAVNAAPAALVARPHLTPTASATLSTGINLVAAGTAQANATASLTTATPLVAAPAIATSIAADLTTRIPLVMSVRQSVIMMATLSTQSRLAAQSTGQSTVTALLTTAVHFAVSSAVQTYIAPPVLSGVTSLLQAQAQCGALGTADLTTGIRLQAAAQVASLARPYLSTAILLAPAPMTTEANAAAALTAQIQMAPFPMSVRTVMQSPDLTIAARFRAVAFISPAAIVRQPGLVTQLLLAAAASTTMDCTVQLGVVATAPLILPRGRKLSLPSTTGTLAWRQPLNPLGDWAWYSITFEEALAGVPTISVVPHSDSVSQLAVTDQQIGFDGYSVAFRARGGDDGSLWRLEFHVSTETGSVLVRPALMAVADQ